jgi:hypothetical protein
MIEGGQHRMKAIKETIGNTFVLIQTMDEKLDVIGVTQEGPDIVDTGIEEELKEAYAKAIIKGIAEDIGAELNTFQAETRPKQMEIEFNMGLSAEAKAWIIGAKSDYALKVKMTWEPGAKEI